MDKLKLISGAMTILGFIWIVIWFLKMDTYPVDFIFPGLGLGVIGAVGYLVFSAIERAKKKTR